MASRLDRWLRPATAALASVALLSSGGCKPSSSNSIQNKGSDTMLEVAQAWAEAYHDVSVEVSGGGSGTGIAALINGTVDIANCSRAMKAEEKESAKKNTGKEPRQSVVGYDALAVYVHKDNPLEEITIEKLGQIYGDGGTITKWSQLGVKVPGCASDTIERASRQNNSGTFVYFREAVVGKKGKYKQGSIDLSGSRDLVEFVSKTPCAIGYSGMGYKTDGVKFLKVKKDAATPGVLPSVAAVHDGTYAIARPLYMYTLGEPTGIEKTYIDWVHGDEAQAILAKIGYVPLSAVEREARAASSGGARTSSEE